MIRNFFFLLLLSAPAQASIFVEPSLGLDYGSAGTSTTENGATTTTSGNIIGYNLGAKAGFRRMFLAVGAEFDESKLKNDTGGSFVGVTDLGAFVGVYLPLVHVWAKYIFSSKTTYEKGNGYGFGAGIPLLLLFSLNFDYTARKYSTYTGSLPAGSSYGGNIDTYALSVSFPFSF